jgi:hypothetical protein
MSLSVNLHLNLLRADDFSVAVSNNVVGGRGHIAIGDFTLFCDRAAIARLHEALDKLDEKLRAAAEAENYDGPSDAEIEAMPENVAASQAAVRREP